MPNDIQISAREWNIILNGLRTAAATYDDLKAGQHPRLAEQFERQAADARTLANRLEAEGA